MYTIFLVTYTILRVKFTILPGGERTTRGVASDSSDDSRDCKTASASPQSCLIQIKLNIAPFNSNRNKFPRQDWGVVSDFSDDSIDPLSLSLSLFLSLSLSLALSRPLSHSLALFRSLSLAVSRSLSLTLT